MQAVQVEFHDKKYTINNPDNPQVSEMLQRFEEHRNLGIVDRTAPMALDLGRALYFDAMADDKKIDAAASGTEELSNLNEAQRLVKYAADIAYYDTNAENDDDASREIAAQRMGLTDTPYATAAANFELVLLDIETAIAAEEIESLAPELGIPQLNYSDGNDPNVKSFMESDASRPQWLDSVMKLQP